MKSEWERVWTCYYPVVFKTTEKFGFFVVDTLRFCITQSTFSPSALLASSSAPQSLSTGCRVQLLSSQPLRPSKEDRKRCLTHSWASVPPQSISSTRIARRSIHHWPCRSAENYSRESFAVWQTMLVEKSLKCCSNFLTCRVSALPMRISSVLARVMQTFKRFSLLRKPT